MLEGKSATIYEVLFQRGSKVRRWDRLLRPEEVDDCLAVFNQFSSVNGVVAIAQPVSVQLPCLKGDFDGEW